MRRLTPPKIICNCFGFVWPPFTGRSSAFILFPFLVLLFLLLFIVVNFIYSCCLLLFPLMRLFLICFCFIVFCFPPLGHQLCVTTRPELLLLNWFALGLVVTHLQALGVGLLTHSFFFASSDKISCSSDKIFSVLTEISCTSDIMLLLFSVSGVLKSESTEISVLFSQFSKSPTSGCPRSLKVYVLFNHITLFGTIVRFLITFGPKNWIFLQVIKKFKFFLKISLNVLTYLLNWYERTGK